MQVSKENLALLKGVSIFTEVPDEILVEALQVIKEVHYGAGQRIIEKGDVGTSMYIIAEGRVRVYDGDRTLNLLGKWDVFGEMAALDTEARSASVSAIEDTRMLCLEQEDLYLLISRHESVARGIIQILAQRLRARVKDMAEDYKYMVQFARVTAAAAAVEAGVYAPESLNEVAERNDELGQLARVFQRMVNQVYTREQSLRQQVEKLRIEIDQAKQARQVAEITETEYFQQLQNRAARLRAERNKE